ncbi:SDR family oxidoreductase [Paenibacillus baimaensis]|uniref:SDR family oxidoreductase n=1 Tax=Paenibacillus baimaensis TaxID=2982185 RepID=UPI0021CEB1D7|nr:NmrA family NAD(P)-binding protein [Paenibacillus sp. WQ 127069]
MVNGSRRLLAAEEEVGVGHHICVSIIGCEKVPFKYYRVKMEQERVIEHGKVPYTIVRATQFHEYIAAMLVQAGRLKMLPLPHMPLQTVAVSEVAQTVANAAEATPRKGRIEIAGPEIIDALELARIWRTVTTGTRGLLLPIPLFGNIKRKLRAGALTANRPDIRGKLRFSECAKEKERYR